MEREYVEDMMDVLPEKNRRNIRRVMDKYGDNMWWRSDDQIEIAKYQVFEDILMVPFGLYHESIEKLLGRPVYNIEMRSSNIENLRNEARDAIELHENGLMETLKRSKAYEQIVDRKIAKILLDFDDEMQRKQEMSDYSEMK